MDTATATQWVIDPAHSEVQFKVKHLVISTVTGSFKTFEGSVTALSDSFEDAEIHFSIDVASIDTNMEMRDGHLKGTEFFDAENHPKIMFQSTSFKKKDGDTYALKGNLTMRGVTKPVELATELGGTATDFYGNTKAGFEVSGKLNRQDFGLVWSGVTEAGSIVVGDEIKLIANIQLVKQQ